MVDPVLRSVSCELNLFDPFFVDTAPEREEDTKRQLCEGRMCGFEMDMKVGKLLS